VTIVARTFSAGQDVRPMLVIGGTKYLASKTVLTTTYRAYISEWETNPSTGAYWTHAQVNALEAGVTSPAAVFGAIRVTQIYISVFAGRYESVALTDPTAGSWNIAKVKVHAFARTKATACADSPDEKLNLGLVIGGTRYLSLVGGRVIHSPNETYKEFTGEWGINPATQDYWTWSDVNALEACVERYEWSNQTGPLWTGEMRVTQLYVEVSGPRLELDICVDYVVDLWAFQFDLTFNPEALILGMFRETDTFKLGPFLESAGGVGIPVPGAGWDNTIGRLSIATAYVALALPVYCPDGGGVLATVTFDVVGQGESEIRLGENTGLKDYTGAFIVKGRNYVQDGYFRNVLTANMPSAKFSATPVSTPSEDGPLEGHYTTFDGTSSTAAGGRTIETYKWYFWQTINSAPFTFPNAVLRPNGDGTYADKTLLPDGDGTYNQWTGTSTDWDDYPIHDGDSTCVNATQGNWNESSSLTNPSITVGSITKVSVTIVARNTLTSDERVRIMLVIGGTGYNGSIHTPTTSYASYTSEWTTNPATASAWTWSAINNLEAGVRSEQVGAGWEGKIKVTQMYVRVDVQVDGADDWTGTYTDWDEVTQDGDVSYVQAAAGGMYESSTLEDHTVEAWPIAKVRVTFFARTTETSEITDELVYPMLVIGGELYNGTRHTLDLTFTEYTNEWSINPATASAWTWSAIDALQAGVVSEQVGSTWTGEIRVTQLYVEVVPAPFISSTDGVSWDTVTWNYTSRGTWNVTLTVIDDHNAVSTNASYVEIKAHDVHVIAITTNTTQTEYPRGLNYTEIGDVMEIDVTVENQGGFPESVNVTCFWSAIYAAKTPNGTIGTQYGITLAAGADTTLIFYWDTEGYNLSHPTYYTLHANASRVPYEYDIEWTSKKVAPNEAQASVRIRFHDIAVTDIALSNYLLLKPDGDGTFTDWSGTYTDWDDYPTHDGDSTTVYATAKDKRESSTLTDHTTETWTIQKVRVTIVARTNISTSDRVRLMLVIGGTPYEAAYQSVTTSYAKYTAEWALNPRYAKAWNWSAIDNLQAGVRSYRSFGTWTSKLMITQLYVEVFGPTVTAPVSQGEMVRVDVTVDNEGDYTETNFYITAYYDSNAIGTQKVYSMSNYTYAEQELAGNSTSILSFIWDTYGVSGGTYTISASNSTAIPDDYEPHDNTFIGGTVTVGAAVPEFPFGVALEIAFIAIIIYIWRKKRHGPKLSKLSTIPNH